MRLHCITDHEYNELIYKLVFRNYKFLPSLSLTSAGYPTIGYGFNLQDDKMLYPVLESLGFDVNAKQLKGAALEAEQYYMKSIRAAFKILGNDTESLNNLVQSILATRLTDKRYLRCHRYKRIARFVFHDKEAVKQCVKATIKNFEKIVDRWLLAFDVEIVNRNPQLFARKSKERIVLFSLAYQGVIGIKPNKTPLFPALGNAFLLDNRPLAWYYIRYNALNNHTIDNVEEVKQRYYESELFGLYDEQANDENITSGQCKQIYAMYREYKDHIIEHEKHYSELIAEANQHFGLSADHSIRSIGQSLALADRHIRNNKTVHPLPSAKNHSFRKVSPLEEVDRKKVVYMDKVIAG
jgi:hypothetical protein